MVDITKEFLHNIFEYNNGNLIYKQDRLIKRKGEIAGSILKKGYIQIGINGKTYLAHRLIFFMFNGFMPKYVDHINGIRNDNRIENLREADSFQNNWNRKKIPNKKFPAKGIYKHSKYDKYCVEITFKGERIHLGIFDTLDEAVKASNNARLKYHGAFANLN
jgi:hypothetical protein